VAERNVFRYPELLNDHLDNAPRDGGVMHGPRTDEQLRFADHLEAAGVDAATRYEEGDALYVETFADQATVDAAVQEFLKR